MINGLIVGREGDSHIATYFREAASALGLSLRVVDPGPLLDRSVPGRILDRVTRAPRHAHSPALDRLIEDLTIREKTDFLLTVGLVSIAPETLDRFRRMGIRNSIYLTDDPWNTAFTSSNLLASVAEYDVVFTPRLANVKDLEALGCSRVVYLPFAYDPHRHYPVILRPEEIPKYACDLMFYGFADADRIRFFKPLFSLGLSIHLYGPNWVRHPFFWRANCGRASPEDLRKACAGARVSLCLVRHQNRDGHSMRSFELAAMGACILAEDTQEHRVIYGEEGERVVYFQEYSTLNQKLHQLLSDGGKREALRRNVAQHEGHASNRYEDRLRTILEQLQSL